MAGQPFSSNVFCVYVVLWESETHVPGEGITVSQLMWMMAGINLLTLYLHWWLGGNVMGLMSLCLSAWSYHYFTILQFENMDKILLSTHKRCIYVGVFFNLILKYMMKGELKNGKQIGKKLTFCFKHSVFLLHWLINLWEIQIPSQIEALTTFLTFFKEFLSL